MVYHYFSWTFGGSHTDTLLGKFGAYGVSIFYILSGITLHHVYFRKLTVSAAGIIDFLKKRVLRIFPLLWFATLMSILIRREFPDLSTLFLNLSGLFGFIAWDKYYATGAWSIGNELVFYAFFPLMIWLSRKSAFAISLFFILCLLAAVYTDLFLLNKALPLAGQWRTYINPLNQICFFASGFIMGYLFHNRPVSARVLLFAGLAGVILFSVYPVTGDPINLVSGITRVALSLSCVLICFTCFKTTVALPGVLHVPLEWLGERSYSVYLVHPLVFTASAVVHGQLSRIGFSAPVYLNLLISVSISLLLSHFIYERFERYFIKLGHRNPQR